MARSISGSVQISVDFTDTNTRGTGTEKKPVKANYQQTFVPGTGGGANEINELWDDQRILAGAGSEELDLAGALVGNFGLTVAFTKVKFIYIELVQTTPAPAGVAVGGAAATQFAAPFGAADDKLNIQEQGALLLLSKKIAGYAVA